MAQFNLSLGLQNLGKQVKVNRRQAVRAVIIKESEILLVQNKNGDYKFPGGGVESGEDPESALRREVKEETGYLVQKILAKLGDVTERNIDLYDESSIFEHLSSYYLCEVTEQKGSLTLDEYEAELDFEPLWVSVEQAISKNESVLQTGEINPWVERDTQVLKLLATRLVGAGGKGQNS